MSASRETRQMTGPVPGKAGTAGNGGIARHGGQCPPGQVRVRDLLGDEVLDALLERSKDADGGLRLTGEGSMLGDLIKAVLERALEGELSAHLGYAKHDPAGNNSGNSRNGATGKTVQTGIGPVHLSVPRDRAGTFAPVLVPKRAGRISGGLDDMIISLYAHGMTVRDILHHLNQVYATELSAEQVSAITDGVLEEVRAWQNRVLDPVWPAVFLDALMVKVRDNHVVTSKPAYIGLGVDADGEKHVLGIWIAKTPLEDATAGESARFWGGVMADLRTRGVRDIIIACCDGLSGFEDAIHSAFPAATVQTCVVHLIRNALRPVARKDRDAVAKELRKIYSAPNSDAAFEALAEFSASPLGNKYPRSVKVWENAWDRFIPFFAFTPGVRKLLYTTNSIESLNYQLRKVTKNRGHFPADDAAVKLLWLAIVNIEDKRARERARRREETGKRHDQPARLIEGQRVMGWREALNELDTAYPGRIR
jgi:putative transposase